MVQFYRGSEDPRDRAFGKLAESLGTGLGNGINTYFANRSLQSVLQDKSLDSADPSERLQAISDALSPYGENGRKVLQNQLMIEQQAMQEKQEKKQEMLQKKKGKALGKYLNGGEISEDEQELFSPQEWVAIHKARNAKQAALGGLGGTPLSPEESKAISDVIKENPNATAEELELQFNEKGIAPGRTKTIIESRRRQDELKAKTGEIREQEIEKSQAQQDVKYNQQLQEAFKGHEVKKRSLQNLDQLNKQGVTGKPWEKLAEKSGLVSLTSDGRREFAADVKNLITDIRSILGAQFTGFEFQTILNAYPSADFSQGANDAIIKNLMVFEDIRDKEIQIAEDLKRENGGKVPIDYQSKVNSRLHKYALTKAPEIKKNSHKIIAEEYASKITPGNVFMLDPQGKPLDVPKDQVEHYKELGAILP